MVQPPEIALNTLKELKERRLVQIVVSYAAGGWVVLGVFSELIDREILPGIVFNVLLVWFFGGLLASVVLGWFHGEKGNQKVTRVEVVILSAIGLLTLAQSTVTLRNHRAEVAQVSAGETPGLPLRRVAVLYFKHRSDGDDLGYLADGLTESLIQRLSQNPSLDVVSPNGTANFRDLSLPLDSIARVLSAGTLVEGAIERRGDELRINVFLVDGASGTSLKNQILNRPSEEIFGLQDDLASEVHALLQDWIGEELQVRQIRGGTESVVAWTLYQRGERARRDGEGSLFESDIDGFVRSFRAADSLYALAEEADPSWASPASQRGALAVRWTQLTGREDPLEAAEWIDAGLHHAARAIRLDPRLAQAHRVKGTLGYLSWQLGLMADPRQAEQLYRQAKEDLLQATRLDQNLADAWNLLSILYSEEPNLVEAKLAARRAFEADEFNRSAESVLLRLYTTSYDLEQFPDAVRYCEEGHRRYPENPSFVECRLWLLFSRAMDPDPEEAWATLDHFLTLVSPQDLEYERIKGRILVGGILARAGLADSAQVVLDQSRSDPSVDPDMELLGVEAMTRLAIGETDRAMDLLRTYLTVNPEHRAGWRWTSHWWWRPLQDNPDFQALVGSG